MSLKEISKASIFGYGWRQRLEVITFTIVLSCGLTALGYFLDEKMGNTKPVLAITLLLLSYPLCQGMLFARYKKIKKTQN